MTGLTAKEVADIMKKEVPALLHERIAELEGALGKLISTAHYMYTDSYCGSESFKWVGDDIDSAKAIINKK